jgi:hypothetical protein
VQIIEATEAGIRAVELRLQRHGSPLQFLLYPMMHIGQPEYYQEIARRLGQADLIVAEGVGRDDAPAETKAAAPAQALARLSSPMYWLTSSYRTMAEDQNLGLVEQNLDYDAIGVPVVCPDFTAEQFDEQWRTIPVWQRGAMLAVAAPVLAAQRLFGSRWLYNRLVNDASMDDLLNPEELFVVNTEEELDRVILHGRDVPLLKMLTDLHEKRCQEPITVAVVYGAAHMRAVLLGLRPLGYRVVSGDWLTVITF